MIKTRNITYDTWYNMKRRCTDSAHERYKDYGARGISISSEWQDFKNFFLDMGEKPLGMTLERKNNELGYSRENCCWVTPTEQMFNQRLRKDSSTKIRGVSFDSLRQKWRAYGTIYGTTKALYFGPSKDAAIKARLDWEKLHNV